MSAGKLLDDLAEKEDCFISSLKAPFEKQKIIHIFQTIPPEQYSLQEWEYSISYLTGCPVHFFNYSELQGFLKAEESGQDFLFLNDSETSGRKKK